MKTVDVKKNKKDLSVLFKDFQWNFIPTSILEGSMGEVLVDDPDNPQTAILSIPEFKISFLGGEANREVVEDYLNDLPFFATLMFGSEEWPQELKTIHPDRWLVMPRFAFSSDSLNIEYLKGLKNKISDRYRIEKINLEIATLIMNEKTEITEEQLFGFESAEGFMKRGMGYCVFEGEEMVSIGAAGVACKKGIEIQINTAKEHKKKGLATAVAAALIIDCLEQGIDPNWDAATEISAGLAKKLGYTENGRYLVYVYTKSKFLVKLINFLRRIRKKDVIKP